MHVPTLVPFWSLTTEPCLCAPTLRPNVSFQGILAPRGKGRDLPHLQLAQTASTMRDRYSSIISNAESDYCRKGS
jgi:hypothetical protein